MLVTRDSRQGPAYPFWLAIQRKLLELDMSQAELVRRSKVTATVIDSLRTSPARNASTRQRNVLTLAAELGIPRDEALQLAGLAEPKPDTVVSVRDAIHRSPNYNADEKKALIGLLDVLDASKRSAEQGNQSA